MTQRTEQAELTCLCMLSHGGRILVQDRLSSEWPGVTFPGGHVEPGESFVQAAVREMREETGLTVLDPVLCGVKQFAREDGARYIVLLFKATRYTGDLKGSSEGAVFWIKREKLSGHQLAEDFAALLSVFESDTLSEFFYEKDAEGNWTYRLM